MSTSGACHAGLVQLAGEKQDEPPLAQRAADGIRTGPETNISRKLPCLFAGQIRIAPALAASQIDLKVSVLFVVFEAGAVGAQISLHHVDEDVLAVHLGAAQRQIVQIVGHMVGGKIVDGGVKIPVEALPLFQ